MPRPRGKRHVWEGERVQRCRSCALVRVRSQALRGWRYLLNGQNVVGEMPTCPAPSRYAASADLMRLPGRGAQ